jgi:hypothetical protein
VRAIVALLVLGAATASPAFTLRSEQQLPFAFNQGVARVDGGWIFSGTDSPIPGSDVLERTDDELNVVTVQPLPIPVAYRNQGYDHVGDIDVEGGVLYVSFEQPDYSLGQQVTAWYDPTTLAFIDAVELPQHENSFVTVDPSTMTAYTMDHFDGDTLLRYDIQAGWQPLAPLQLTMTLHHTQGADIARGAVWISTSDDHNGVYRVDLQTGDTTSVGTLGHQGLEGEGIDATSLPSGAFHGMVNDPLGPFVYFGHYDLADAESDATSSSSSSGLPSSQQLPATGGRWGWGWAGAALLVLAGGAWRLRRLPS